MQLSCGEIMPRGASSDASSSQRFCYAARPFSDGTVYAVGHQEVGETVAAEPGWSLSRLVDDLPGWLYEANGVLHPRSSEYDVQYVVDGLPITENRSPRFAPSLDADAVDSAG